MPMYLMFDHGGVLDGEMTQEAAKADDLILSNLGDGVINILPHGVKVVEQLLELTTLYNCQIVFHSKNKESDQLRILQQLQNACLQKSLIFPTVTAMAVYDPISYPNVSPASPVIIKDRSHGIWVVGYGIEKDGKSCVREALSAALTIPVDQREQHKIFDDGPSVLATAYQEGYQGYLIGRESGSFTLAEAVEDVYQSFAPQSRSSLTLR